MEIVGIEVVDDRTAESRTDVGFLQVRRLSVRNRHADGTAGEPYACDVMSRTNVDAVAVILYEPGADRRIQVVLKEGMRPAIWLRREKDLVLPDEQSWLYFPEMCAGVLEAEDASSDAVSRRAAAEAHEECGTRVAPDAVSRLGRPSFPSPGVTDEKVYFAAAAVRIADASAVEGDGSGMEAGTRRLVLDLREALARCRDGRIPDMKTEIALLRLCDRLGYLPQLDVFVDELPPGLRERYAPPGLEPA